MMKKMVPSTHNGCMSLRRSSSLLTVLFLTVYGLLFEGCNRLSDSQGLEGLEAMSETFSELQYIELNKECTATIFVDDGEEETEDVAVGVARYYVVDGQFLHVELIPDEGVEFDGEMEVAISIGEVDAIFYGKDFVDGVLVVDLWSEDYMFDYQCGTIISVEVITPEQDLLSEFAFNIPETATLIVQHPGTSSYFDAEISWGDMDKITVDAWCIDTDHTITSGRSYMVNVFSSYDELPSGLVEYPENLDLVNWVLNQNFVGTSSGCGDGGELYTYKDVQRAIWELIEDGQSSSGVNGWSSCRVDEIVEAAKVSGDGFVPACGDIIGLILQPVDEEGGTSAQVTIAQVILGEILFECDQQILYARGSCAPCYLSYMGCETAWAAPNEDVDMNVTCFLDIEEFDGESVKLNRWGWSIHLGDSYEAVHPLYAGAGQCDTEKGLQVGTVEIALAGNVVTVVYDIFEGFDAEEIHLYVGAAPVLKVEKEQGKKTKVEYTVAPGLFPYDMEDATVSTDGGETYSFEIDGLNGPLYLAAHAVVCNDPDYLPPAEEEEIGDDMVDDGDL